jgi:two-component system cell cycle response regulator DivK
MSSHSATILYVEDNMDNLTLVKRVLQAEGVEVLEAKNAAEGLKLARERHLDLIIADIQLPEIDGLTLTTLLKSDPRFEDIPIIAITANVLEGARERSLAAGCNGFIQKPIDVDHLPGQILRYLVKE